MAFVLDASAMIAYLRNEAGADEVSRALLDQGHRCFAHSLNLCEVYYDFYRASGPADARAALDDLRQVGVVENTAMDNEFWQSAGALKAIQRRVSLADCFAITLANRLEAAILTADHHEFEVLVRQKVCKVLFIR